MMATQGDHALLGDRKFMRLPLRAISARQKKVVLANLMILSLQPQQASAEQVNVSSPFSLLFVCTRSQVRWRRLGE